MLVTICTRAKPDKHYFVANRRKYPPLTLGRSFSRPESLGAVSRSANRDPSGPTSRPSVLYEQRDSLHSRGLFHHSLRAQVLSELHELGEESVFGQFREKPEPVVGFGELELLPNTAQFRR